MSMMRHLFSAAACFTLGTTASLTFFLALAIFDPQPGAPSAITLLWLWYASATAFTLSTLIANYQAATRQWSEQ